MLAFTDASAHHISPLTCQRVVCAVVFTETGAVDQPFTVHTVELPGYLAGNPGISLKRESIWGEYWAILEAMRLAPKDQPLTIYSDVEWVTKHRDVAKVFNEIYHSFDSMRESPAALKLLPTNERNVSFHRVAHNHAGKRKAIDGLVQIHPDEQMQVVLGRRTRIVRVRPATPKKVAAPRIEGERVAFSTNESLAQHSNKKKRVARPSCNCGGVNCKCLIGMRWDGPSFPTNTLIQRKRRAYPDEQPTWKTFAVERTTHY